MKSIINQNGNLVDDVYGWNLLCCLDECVPECGITHRCWLSPYAKQQFEINFPD
jgi:hypothetical protein